MVHYFYFYNSKFVSDASQRAKRDDPFPEQHAAEPAAKLPINGSFRKYLYTFMASYK